MKKLSLFSLLGVAGLLAFVATPIYAQEEDVNFDEEQIVVETEEIRGTDEDLSVEVEDVDAEDVAIVVDDENGEEMNESEIDAEESTDLDEIDFNAIFENEDVQQAITEAGLTNEEAAGLLGGALGLFAGLGIVGIIIAIVWGILLIIAMWKIFEKAGEAGWKSIIPIYNVYIMYKIVGMKNWFWYELIAVVVACIVTACLGEESSVGGVIRMIAYLFSGIVSLVAAFKLPRSFGWGVFASILFIIFTGICTLILGFGDSKYQGKSEDTIVEA